jgi:hypothetical protein
MTFLFSYGSIRQQTPLSVYPVWQTTEQRIYLISVWGETKTARVIMTIITNAWNRIGVGLNMHPGFKASGSPLQAHPLHQPGYR